VNAERIIELKQMGEKLASSLAGFFGEKENINSLEALKKLGVTISNPDFEGEGTKNQKRPLEGLTIVVTGTLSRPRNEIEELIEKNGGHTTGSVSKKSRYVLAGIEPGKNKIDKAKELNITVIDEKELSKMIGGGR
jgi:DNA ligase (NAD+)